MKGPPLPPHCFETINAAVRAATNHTGSRVAFVDLHERETCLTAPAMFERAGRAAGALRHLGLRRGDRAVIILPTSPGFMDAFFGVLMAGAIPAALAPPLQIGGLSDYKAGITRMIAAIGARIVLTNRRIRNFLDASPGAAPCALGCHEIDSLVNAGFDAIDEPVAPSHLALIQFSSGSTTNPKPVALTHRQVMAQVTALRSLMLASAVTPQAGVSWLPLYHDMGLVGPLLTAVCNGQYELALIRPEHFLVKPALWLRTISRFRAQHSPAPNFGYALCVTRVRDEEMEGVDLSSWRYALNGAEPVSMDVIRRFTERFARWGFQARALTPVYGLAEAALAVTFSDPDALPHGMSADAAVMAASGQMVPGRSEIACVGRPVPGAEVEVRDERGATAPERRVGRIFVRGPSIMAGYYGDADATARALDHGWLDTGDLGFVAGGELYVTGRAKDVVIIRGANYTSQMFEACLEQIEGVRADGAVAIGYVPPGADGEELLVLAERVPPAGAAEDSVLSARIHQAVLARTGVRPYAVRVLDPGSLPRTSSGKPRRAEALRRFQSGVL